MHDDLTVDRAAIIRMVVPYLIRRCALRRHIRARLRGIR